MRLADIRIRLLLASLLPVTMIAIVLSAVFLVARVTDVDAAHGERSKALLRQLVSASEYGLFSVNVGHLQSIAQGALREVDLHSVVIVDAQGHILVSAGKPAYLALPALTRSSSSERDLATRMDVLSQPVLASQVRLDDLFEARSSSAAAQQLLGHVVIEVSNETLLRREREMMLAGVGITLAGLLLGCLLALRLGRDVLQPILRVSGMVERIGSGDLSVRAKVLPNDPLHDLQRGLNAMAGRLESGRDEMERRIAVATLALREKKEEAETATLDKSRFLATASHDLRQPIHALGMFVARLGQLPHDAQTQALIANLEVAVQATQDLLDGLLDISRLDARAVPVQLRPFALADLFKQLRSGAALIAAEKGLRLRIRPTDVWLMSDPTLLHRILQNLLGNALRYTQHGGVLLACRLTADGKHARIEIWDSGVGIAPEHHQAIFREFYQIGNQERDRGKGLGLGLNIVKRTAALLGHGLKMSSRPGVGTRFSIEVPVVPLGASMDRRSSLRAKAFDDLTGLLVMVIEDDPMAREGLASLLTSWGSTVLQAEGLSEAQRQLQHGVLPDLIISDYRLRDGENGIEVVRKLHGIAGQQIPACLMSGDTDQQLMQAARVAGLTLLFKPVRPAKLRSLIRRLVTSVQADGELLA